LPVGPSQPRVLVYSLGTPLHADLAAGIWFRESVFFVFEAVGRSRWKQRQAGAVVTSHEGGTHTPPTFATFESERLMISRILSSIQSYVLAGVFAVVASSSSLHAQDVQPVSVPTASAAPAPSKAVGMPASGGAAAPGSAVSTGTPGGVPAAGPAQGSGSSMLPIFMLVAMGILFIPMIFAGRREAKKKAELLSSIKKGDQIQTAGGIIGYVHDLNQDDLVLRLEDGRMRVAKSAVVGILKATSAKSEVLDSKPQGKTAEA
jgi:preprotein translocase subunit YajC